jgi:phosphonate transport system substrate-binding protein
MTWQRFLSVHGLAAWLFAQLAVSPVFADAQKVLTFGIAPQQSPSTLVRIWGPILREVGDEAGVKLVFKTAPDVSTFEKRLMKGEYDIAYMNPYHYIEAHKKQGYLPLLHARDRQLRGILVTRRDASYHSVADLSGQTLAFPAPDAFAASLLVQEEFARQQVPITPKYVASHDSVYLDVAKGLFPAGGGIMRTFNALNPTVRDQLHVIYVSRGYTPHAIAHLPGIPAETAAQIQSAFIRLDKSVQGRQLLAPLEIKGWEAARDTDWDDVRALCKVLSIKSYDQ